MSRADARSNRLRRRPSRTVPATIASLLLLALGVGLAWITVLWLLNGSWPSFLGAVNSWATALTWGSTAAIAISLAVVLLGLFLLVAAWKPGQPTAMVLQAENETPEHNASDLNRIGSTEFVMTRHAVAKLATTHADQVDGVDSVAATVSARGVELSVKSASEQRTELQRIVTDRVHNALAGAGLHPVPTVTTTVHTQRL